MSHDMKYAMRTTTRRLSEPQNVTQLTMDQLSKPNVDYIFKELPLILFKGKK